MRRVVKNTSPKLLTRDEFRNKALFRDNYKCIVCGEKSNLSVHHIFERRLFNDGGYYIENAATLCEKHHIEAEQTVLSVEEILRILGITQRILPDHLDNFEKYDKWGNQFRPDGRRIPGELFYDQSIQKILSCVLDQFTSEPYVKYPRTAHCPWSPGCTSDDKIHQSMNFFTGKEVVVTEKMDGSNYSLYRDYCHGRSLNEDSHPQKNWIKNLHSQIAYNIPERWRICGENLYAKHSIHYTNLKSFFYTHSIWNDKNECLSWHETKLWVTLLELDLVPVIYEGVYDEKLIRELSSKYMDNCGHATEGYVIRAADSFKYNEFSLNVAKYVRKDHVSTPHNWKHMSITPNIITSQARATF